MTRQEIENMISEIEIPVAYHHFTTHNYKDPPFVVWNVPGTNNFFADGKTYQKIKQLDIELYTDKKDFELEEKIEKILDENGIAWQQTASQWIESEMMWESLYEMEV